MRSIVLQDLQVRLKHNPVFQGPHQGGLLQEHPPRTGRGLQIVDVPALAGGRAHLKEKVR